MLLVPLGKCQSNDSNERTSRADMRLYKSSFIQRADQLTGLAAGLELVIDKASFSYRAPCRGNFSLLVSRQ